jgi:hypothetical protein
VGTSYVGYRGEGGGAVALRTRLNEDWLAVVIGLLVFALPLLPIEKKLIGWSLGIGIALLVVLIVVNHFVPIKL